MKTKIEPTPTSLKGVEIFLYFLSIGNSEGKVNLKI